MFLRHLKQTIFEAKIKIIQKFVLKLVTVAALIFFLSVAVFLMPHEKILKAMLLGEV